MLLQPVCSGECLTFVRMVLNYSRNDNGSATVANWWCHRILNLAILPRLQAGRRCRVPEVEAGQVVSVPNKFPSP